MNTKTQIKSQVDVRQSIINRFSIPVLQRRETMTPQAGDFNTNKSQKLAFKFPNNHRHTPNSMEGVAPDSDVKNGKQMDLSNPGNMTIRESDHESNQESLQKAVGTASKF